jgi:hypothetical protein
MSPFFTTPPARGSSAAPRKPAHWTQAVVGNCRLCRTLTPQTAKHTTDPSGHEQVERTCDRCGGMVSRYSVRLGSRR